MKILSLDIQIKKTHQNPKEFCEETFVFQKNYIQYVIRKINNRVELWGYSKVDTDEVYYLGFKKNDTIIYSDDFRTYPWDIQKGAGRLCRIYLHNDYREL